MSRIKVCIIIINFGTPEHTIECLQSIAENNYKYYNVVIVDVIDINKSVEKITIWIEDKNDDRFVLIRENENNGFAYSNNEGIKYSQQNLACDCFWVLNNDTVIAQDSLDKLVQYYEQESVERLVGFVGSKTMDYDDKELIQNVGGVFNRWTGYSVLVGMGDKDNHQYDNAELKVDYIVGASMFFHKTLIEHIGLMPEDYFLYYEDIDWCLTAQKAGYTNLTCIKSVVYHKQGMSTGAKLLSDDNHLKNKKHLYLSYLKLYKRQFKTLLPIAYIILFKQLAGRVYHKDFTEAKLILKVIFSH